MSYRRTYNGVISGSKTQTVSYPKSDSGGSKSVTVSYSEPFTVHIDVDTDPVDEGIAICRSELDSLENSIRIGAASQAAEKAASTVRIVKATKDGFATLIFSEIDQQLVALSSRLQSATALLLAETQEAGKREIQFTKDFQRIKERYSSLFDTLNTDLDRRIRALDEPVFNLVRADFRERISSRMTGLPAETALNTAEMSSLPGRISGSLAKRRILELLEAIRGYLGALIKARAEMASVLLSERVEDAVEISLPFALIEKSGSTSNVTEVIGCPGDQVPALDFKRLTAAMKSLSWSPAAGAQAEQVTSHFMELVERSFDLSDPVQKRQAELAVSLMRDNPWLTAN